MTAWIITTDRINDNNSALGFNCAGSYSPAQEADLKARLVAGEGQPFLMGDDDWNPRKPDTGENGDYLYFRGRVIFDEDMDAEAGCWHDNMLIAWGENNAGCSQLIVSPGDTTVPRSDWKYRGI